ncbi:hypothetical protein PR001_g23402 [Phytophthora rubi]|uniref:Uncharacterized protein n=1 Tax=Phytophthora rubi TaxID=129364 RepID=A0A6A3IL06_9STRA|nr:hypothetical protein PR001_g23402 [Phytophthora rubi]
MTQHIARWLRIFHFAAACVAAGVGVRLYTFNARSRNLKQSPYRVLRWGHGRRNGSQACVVQRVVGLDCVDHLENSKYVDDDQEFVHTVV